METWYDIPGYEGLYQLSSLDHLKSLSRLARVRNGGTRITEEKIKEFTRTDEGYLFTSLWKDGKGKSYSLHYLKLLTFVGSCPSGMECRHLDGDSQNNDLSNLCWGTPKENGEDKIKQGTTVKGRKGNSYKLKAKKDEILELFDSGVHSAKSLAVLFGTTVTGMYGFLARHGRRNKKEVRRNGATILH